MEDTIYIFKNDHFCINTYNNEVNKINIYNNNVEVHIDICNKYIQFLNKLNIS